MARHHPEEVARDLSEEACRLAASGWSRPRLALWWVKQIVGVAMYEHRDKRLQRGGGSLHLGLAIRLALRGLRRSPATPIAAALTLAVGFGAAAAIHGVYTGFGGPLPVPDGAGVMWVRVLDERGRAVALSATDAATLHDAASAFDDFGMYTAFGATLRVPERGSLRASGAAMTASAFDLLRVTPLVGRVPRADDINALVIGYSIWRDLFDNDPEVLGQTARLDGVEHVIVGVMPEGHRFPFNHDFWTAFDPTTVEAVDTVVRIAEGTTPERAATEVAAVMEGLRTEAAIENPGVRVEIVGFTEKRGESGEKAILATVLALVVALVLVSCSNVSNLLLARALARTDSLAVHAALGAGPRQVILQTLIDALVISLAGAVLGLGVGALGIRYIESTLSGHWGYYWMEVRFDPGVMVFTLGLAVAAGLVAGTLPAFRLHRTDLAGMLRADATAITGSRRGLLSGTMLNVQVALSCFALIVAMLLASALLRSRIAPDFPAEQIYVASLALDSDAYDADDDRRAYLRGLLADARDDDRIGAVALSTGLPGINATSSRLEIEGVAVDPEARPAVAPGQAVSRSYFELFDLDLVSGELFPEVSDAATDAGVVVSRSFVAQHLGSEDPLGRRIKLPSLSDDAWLRIVGVVDDLEIYADEDPRSRSRVYVPFDFLAPRSTSIFHRAGPQGADVAAAAMQSTIAARDPDIAVTGAFGQDSYATIADLLAYVRRLFQTAGLLAIYGGAGAAVVALIGLYGALAFEIQRRRAEIGVRMALGASAAAVVRHTARAGLLRVAPGLTLGFLMSATISPTLGVLLGRMNPRDPVIYMGVYFAFLLTAIIATVIPGRRASRLDPVAVLRKD